MSSKIRYKSLDFTKPSYFSLGSSAISLSTDRLWPIVLKKSILPDCPHTDC